MSEMIKLKNNIGFKELEEKLRTLTDDFGMSTECLSNLLGVKNDGHKFEIPTGYELHSFLFSLLMLDNIVNEEPDFKFKAFLEVLIEVHKISPDTIAKFAKIKKQDVLDFINDTNTVPIEIKYRLASVIMTLRFIFKAVEPKI
ncbi:HTH domain-containing protein [Desulfosporosinus sp. FKA]|uniref:HTH domain-containing protein n=1 Tax=Desulfosporosinus sp. FKA TaxID=1969834 RepID=UPI000B4A47E8|nr:HTH domain-containing protein [Desulfosporosinus sp. FKA]